MHHRLIRKLILAALLLPSLAVAHGNLPHAGFLDGLAHPFAGLDHALAAVAVGLLAGRLATRQVWLIPLAFVLTMIGGALVSLAGIAVPATEIMIVLSVIALGFAVAVPNTLGLAATGVLVGFFALFHGYAHGVEASGGSFAEHIAGLVLATSLLHALGVCVAVRLRRGAARFEPTLRVLGRLLMIAGVVFAMRLV